MLDLLRVAIAAGLAPRRALAEVGRRHPGLLAAELKRAAARAAMGEPADATLDAASRRAAPPTGIAALVAALQTSRAPRRPTRRRARRPGAPRRARAAAAHRSEQAAKAAPKIQLVVALLLVPAVLLLVAAALIPALTTR